MKEPIRDHNADYQLASAVARYVELKDVRLTDVQARIHASPERILGTPNLELKLGRNMSCSFVDNDKLVIVEAKLKTDILAPSQKRGSEQLLIDISCTFVLEYWFRVQGGPEGDEQARYLDAFAHVNGVYNVWPYYRELVQSMSSRMSIPPIVVPVYRVPRETAPVAAVAPAKNKEKAPQPKAPKKR